MSNTFSSLENFNEFIINLINLNKDALPLKHISKIINDLSNLLDESDFYDVEIKVGVGEDSKIFKVHSTILKARSSYFKIALSNNWVKRSEYGVILFEKENISSKIFEVLITYIYNGIINTDDLDPDEILELLEACDELSFNELFDYLQEHLFVEKKEWVKNNLIHLHKFSLQHQSFIILQDYFKELIHDNPELFLKSDDFKDIEKSMLIFLLEKDDLKIKEIDIWDHVIQWGIGQIEDNLEEKTISEWHENDFIELKNILDDIIPLIRFNQIATIDFNKKIRPLRKVFNKAIYGELQYYGRPKLLLPKDQRIVKKNLLKLKLKSLISSWIDDGQDQITCNENNLTYDFELILQGTRDGFSRTVFENRCYDIKQTVAIMKIKDTGELVGGYNSVGWNVKERSSDEEYWIETNKNFIFKIDENQIKNSIISRVRVPRGALYHNSQAVDETINNIKFHEISINFIDLVLYNSVNNEPYCYYYFIGNLFDAYEKDLNLSNNSDGDKIIYLLEEYEVYKIVKK